MLNLLLAMDALFVSTTYPDTISSCPTSHLRGGKDR